MNVASPLDAEDGRYLLGVDIGGTKCAVVVGQRRGSTMSLVAHDRFSTPSTPEAALTRIMTTATALLAEHAIPHVSAVGISCGGPLDTARGLILAPPNLPGWEAVDVVTPLRQHFAVPTLLENDANAGALAEWWWGAGQGCHNLIFLTFGTGMGAGLILNGALYRGANDQAGEVGHVRLAPAGPLGYGKAGSLEGFASGGGIAQQARHVVAERLTAGEQVSFCATPADLSAVTAETVGRAAQQGDPLAQEIFKTVGEYLGQGLALLVDVLNPERIILGSIYVRQHALLAPTALATLHSEALPRSLAVCDIVPSGLGEHIGDFAGLAVAEEALFLALGVRT